MKHKISAVLLVFVCSLVCYAKPAPANYQVSALTGYTTGQGTRFIDPNLNGWGMVRMPTGTYAVANPCPGVVTFYPESGVPLPLTITVPAAPSQPFGPVGSPAGIVYNSTSEFVISANGRSAPALLIFDTLDGTISGWNPIVDPTNAIIMFDGSTQPIPASYTGLAIGKDSHGRNILYGADGGYAPDFSNNRVDMFDGHWNRVGMFGDSNASVQYPGNTVFQVEYEDGQIFVTYGGFSPPFGGLVDLFDRDGNLLTPNHFAANQPGAGPLANPWGIARAPAKFGSFSNAILIGNVEDGHINAFDNEGHFLGPLTQNGTPIVIPGLWDLDFVVSGGKKASSAKLFFNAGPNVADFCGNGLFGFISTNGK